MRSKLVSSVYFIAALLCPFAYAQERAGAVPAAFKPAAAIPARGTLYRVNHQGNSAYLFGTIHVGKATFYPLEPRVTEAFAKATKLALELDVRNNASFERALLKYGLYPAGESIREHILPQTYERMLEALQRFSFPVHRVMRMKPWLAANLLMGLEMEKSGYNRNQGIEYYLLAAATAQSKPILELENAEYQLALFDTMSADEQEQYLREALDGLADGSVAKKTNDLISAWSSADDKMYEALVRDAMNDKSKMTEFTQRILLDKRNPEMATKIEALLQSEPSSFVGIGLLHMLGESSVPALLKQRGYTVEKIY